MGCDKKKGPEFGNSELLVFSEPFDEPNACWSTANCSGYMIPVDREGKSMLTNKKIVKIGVIDKCIFTISSIEVWGVTWKD
jgi:hypothetical protein